MTPLAIGLHEVAQGTLPTVVTYLDMTKPQSSADLPLPIGVTAQHKRLSVEIYRDLFRAIGTPWLWTSRLMMDDMVLADTLGDKDVETWVIAEDGQDIGLVELDFRASDSCELAFFGLVRSATGKGLGTPMMAFAQSRAFARPITRLHLHTCTLDAPQALGFYQRHGFRPYKRAVEVLADPRQTGLHAKTASPHIPFID